MLHDPRGVQGRGSAHPACARDGPPSRLARACRSTRVTAPSRSTHRGGRARWRCSRGGCGGGGPASRGDAGERRRGPPPRAARARALRAAARADRRPRRRPRAATELSGLVLSRSQRGVLWTHNDSGDARALLAVGLDGRAARRRRADGRRGRSTGRTSPPARDALYVGDIGDNVAQRDVDRRLPRAPSRASRRRRAGRDGRREPHRAALPRRARATPRRCCAIRQRRARRRRRSASAAAPAIYVADQPVAGSDDDAAPPRQRSRLGAGEAVTAGDVSADGRTIVLRTYASAFVWRAAPRRERRGRAAAAAVHGRARACSTEGQGEALALARDGRAFYTVPEGRGAARCADTRHD